MTEEERRHAAQAILSIPFFIQLWDELEQAAVNGCIFAKYDDHEGRQAHAAEARAIKQVRQRIESIANGGQIEAGRSAPA